MAEATDCVLMVEGCNPNRITANKVMLCIRNEFMLMNRRDVLPEEFYDILKGSGDAGIIKL